jgi:glycosyltransferase involved in cell wall biosynthesis
MMNNNPLISVAMATYNGSLYIACQLNSIISQTYKDIEIIIVDDCSSDETVPIIRQYQKLHTNIRLIQNPTNMGVVKAFAKAMSLCNGEYIALSDQDDVWFNNKLEKLLDNIGDSLLIYSDAVVVDDNMQVLASSNITQTKKERYKTGEFIDYLISTNVTGCTTLFTRKLLGLALPIPDGFYIHDHYLAIVASFYGTVKFLDEPLVYYRQHVNNVIGAKRLNFDNFLQNCQVVANSYSLLLSVPEFKNNFYIELLRDYRLSVYMGRWTSKFSIFRLLQIKHGMKLLVYYMLLSGIFSRGFAKKVYNFIYKL